jgi:hypothetical protein
VKLAPVFEESGYGCLLFNDISPDQAARR